MPLERGGHVFRGHADVHAEALRLLEPVGHEEGHHMQLLAGERLCNGAGGRGRLGRALKRVEVGRAIGEREEGVAAVRLHHTLRVLLRHARRAEGDRVGAGAARRDLERLGTRPLLVGHSWQDAPWARGRVLDLHGLRRRLAHLRLKDERGRLGRRVDAHARERERERRLPIDVDGHALVPDVAVDRGGVEGDLDVGIFVWLQVALGRGEGKVGRDRVLVDPPRGRDVAQVLKHERPRDARVERRLPERELLHLELQVHRHARARHVEQRPLEAAHQRGHRQREARQACHRREAQLDGAVLARAQRRLDAAAGEAELDLLRR